MPTDFEFDVFLSHSSKDKAVVRPLAERLRKDGLRVWFDEWELKAGDSIPAKIEEGLEHSRVLVLCMSANAFGSDWAQLEAGTFRFRDPLNKERRFIPIRLDDAHIKGSLAQFRCINWLPKDRGQEYAKLLEACRPPAKQHQTVAELDSLELAWYESRFENMYLRAKGDRFQTFFEELMGRAYPGDFMASRPWGNRGDRKNDGFLRSERRLFQVYAPNEMTEAEAKKKMTEDLTGALEYWGQHFDIWVFVHNAADGLPPHVQEFILELGRAQPGKRIETWGLQELKAVLKRFSRSAFESWLGYAPSRDAETRVGYSDLAIVLEHLARKEPPADMPVKDVPRGKLQANDLSRSVRDLLQAGMRKAPMVERFFNGWHEPTYGTRLAAAFRERYRELKAQTAPPLHPDEMYHELLSWAGGGSRQVPEHEVAVLAVLAYFFEQCEIFEAPRIAAS